VSVHSAVADYDRVRIDEAGDPVDVTTSGIAGA
jgi:hypothetical protein